MEIERLMQETGFQRARFPVHRAGCADRTNIAKRTTSAKRTTRICVAYLWIVEDVPGLLKLINI